MVFWKSRAHLAGLVPATVQMRGRSRGRAENICLLCFFLFFILKHKLICEGLERALLRMHRSMLTLYICGILCLHGGGSGGVFHCLCDLTSQNQRTKKDLLKVWFNFVAYFASAALVQNVPVQNGQIVWPPVLLSACHTYCFTLSTDCVGLLQVIFFMALVTV